MSSVKNGTLAYYVIQPDFLGILRNVWLFLSKNCNMNAIRKIISIQSAEQKG